MADRSPGAPPGIKGEDWATKGFTEVEPADPAASQGDADSLGRPDPNRNQLDPASHFPQAKELQRGELKPLKSKYIP